MPTTRAQAHHDVKCCSKSELSHDVAYWWEDTWVRAHNGNRGSKAFGCWLFVFQPATFSRVEATKPVNDGLEP
jgi:hypothetical protein